MDELLNSILSPNTVVSIITSLTAFYSSYKMLEQRVKNLEDKVKEVDVIDLKTQLAEIKTNLNWIMEEMKKN